MKECTDHYAIESTTGGVGCGRICLRPLAACIEERRCRGHSKVEWSITTMLGKDGRIRMLKIVFEYDPNPLPSTGKSYWAFSICRKDEVLVVGSADTLQEAAEIAAEHLESEPMDGQ